MDKKVYILHGSEIVQTGLANILRENFKCEINCFSDFSSFLDSEGRLNQRMIIFAEDSIASNAEYLNFIDKDNELNSFCIVDGQEQKTPVGSQKKLFLQDTAYEIYELVKDVFNLEEPTEDKTEALTSREIDVLKLIALGNSNKEIADKLFISTHTVMSHRKNMTEKLGIKSISGLTVYAIINEYIDTTNLVIKDLI